ncbi:Ribonucleases P/MRP protein subunit pop1 [Pseudocercospora fuligena]|uniref:Ribonucleases P/MRP protein subunit pop1 n=1 Tax=Pseudocercospora fuligena TaxID=685502 RepID=A0A8H6VGN7_9PEZI|nr:Ribonucleases P/MRP protein subunit pop1 [Pseudocercospora fuligena]
MAPPNPPKPAHPNNASKKRKEPPTNASNSKNDNKRPKNDHRAKQRDARALASQTSSKAFKNGELDVDKFVKAREYEIRALEEGMARSKKALTTRAFQQVPKELRRRMASHNVKRVPKRLQKRAKVEMVADNTPTVTARRRKPTRHMRLRMETAKKLRPLGAAQRKASKKVDDEEVTVRPVEQAKEETAVQGTAIKTRAPKVKKAKLAEAPTPKAKFRKRQMNKTWLPTHMFHAKRARMTPPKEPLWRFAIPLTPTAKCYRPTHRAANDRGAVAWDVSYMSTIGLEGQQRSIEGMLKALNVDENLWTRNGEKWRNGSRAWDGFVFEREAPHRPIAPVTVIWSPSSDSTIEGEEFSKRKRKVLLRVHPSAFLQLWQEILRLSKVAKPQVSVEDLRFEIGGIEVTGPGATEALLGALWPSPCQEGSAGHASGSAEKTWTSLAGLTDISLIPKNIALGLDVQDSRLHHPPRTIKLPTTAAEQMKLLELTASWPVDAPSAPFSLLDRRARIGASSSLPSQKAVNRRKSLAAPGQYPEAASTDPRIPTTIYSTSSGARRQASWIVLLPWKAVLPIWYGVIYYPLSTGGQPRFGGLDEKRQLCFEAGQPWFPGDFPGTKAGWEWETQERKRREDEWRRWPKSKRVNWDAVKLANGKKGEIGTGWACDWERLINGPPQAAEADTREGANDGAATTPNDDNTAEANKAGPAPSIEAPKLAYLPRFQASTSLSSYTLPSTLSNPLITTSLTCLAKGTPQTCARIYRLPSSNQDLRKSWLSLHPQNRPKTKSSHLPKLPKDAPPHIVQRRLAQSLLEPARAGEENYPEVPDEEDLIGFVTTGNLNLAEGRGTGVGSILLERVLEDVKRDAQEGQICIVRNAGQSIGRLAKWELV